ncbi:MAG: EAL domain-containing protein [Cellulomonas sp.]
MTLLHDRPAAAIVASTIDLAWQLNLTTVAEGVEDDATLLALYDMHCDAVQGFGIGRPVPGDQIPDLITTIERRLPDLFTSRTRTKSPHRDGPQPREGSTQDVPVPTPR